jgi:hypothetical protein
METKASLNQCKFLRGEIHDNISIGSGESNINYFDYYRE